MIVIYEGDTLRVSTEYRPLRQESANPRRMRRGYYVGQCCAIACLGILPLESRIKDILQAIALGAMNYERDGKFHLPEGMADDGWFGKDNETSYVIMTANGLYFLGEIEEFQKLDFMKTQAFGSLSHLFYIALQGTGSVEGAVKELTSWNTKSGKHAIILTREHLKKEFVFDPSEKYSRWLGDDE